MDKLKEIPTLQEALNTIPGNVELIRELRHSAHRLQGALLVSNIAPDEINKLLALADSIASTSKKIFIQSGILINIS